MKHFIILYLLVCILGCKNETKTSNVIAPNATEILNKSITEAGGKKIENSIIEFDFRDKHYKAKRNNGAFELDRSFKNSTALIKDVLSNNGFERYIDDQLKTLETEKEQAYSASVNSVHYFSVLPHGLNDKAVNKALIGEEQIKNQTYYKIKVTFNQNGGGEDYEDVFIYWINKQTFKPDYLAYSYNEDDGKGMRFREAYNERYIKGLRFVDYNNYKTDIKNPNLKDLGKYFNDNRLKIISKIALKNIKVDLINL